MNVHTHGHMRIKVCGDLSELAVNSLQMREILRCTWCEM